MKVYVITTNTDFACIVKADNAAVALDIAKGYMCAQEGVVASFIKAEEALEFMDEGTLVLELK